MTFIVHFGFQHLPAQVLIFQHVFETDDAESSNLLHISEEVIYYQHLGGYSAIFESELQPDASDLRYRTEVGHALEGSLRHRVANNPVARCPFRRVHGSIGGGAKLVRATAIIRVQRQPDAKSGAHLFGFDDNRFEKRRLQGQEQDLCSFQIFYVADDGELVAARAC